MSLGGNPKQGKKEYRTNSDITFTEFKDSQEEMMSKDHLEIRADMQKEKEKEHLTWDLKWDHIRMDRDKYELKYVIDWEKQQSLIDLENEDRVKNAIVKQNIYDLETLIPGVCSLAMTLYVKNRMGEESTDTPMSACVKTGWASGVKYLLGCYKRRDRMAELDKKDETGVTLVHCAITNSEIMGLLLDAGLNPTSRDMNNNTPAMLIKIFMDMKWMDKKKAAEAQKNLKLIEAAVRKRVEQAVNARNDNNNNNDNKN